MEETKLLWPSRFSRDWLARRKDTVGSFSYAKEYLVTPLSDDTKVFQLDWMQFYKPEDLDLERRILNVGDEPRRITGIYAGVDLAISERQKADYFALVTVGVTDKQDFCVLDAYKGRLSFKRQVEMIEQKYAKYRHNLVAIESNAFQALMKKYLVSTTLLPIKGFVTTKDKLVRSRRMSAHFENGKVWVRQDMTDLIEELLQFPSGAHDDLVDALEFAIDQFTARANFWSKSSGVSR